MFIQLGQIKVNVAHSGAKHKSKKIVHKNITTKQEYLKTTSTSQDNQCWVIKLKLTKNEKKYFQRAAVVSPVDDGWTGCKLFKGNLAPIWWLTHNDQGL